MIRTAFRGVIFVLALALCQIPAAGHAGGLLDGNLQCVDLSDLDGDLPLDVVSSTELLWRTQDWEHSKWQNPDWPEGGNVDLGYPTMVKNTHGPNPDGKYYLYYAHHDPMSGIGVTVADNIMGPYTKANVMGSGNSMVLASPFYDPDKPQYGYSAYMGQHFSSPSAVWNEDEQLWFIYFHYYNEHYWEWQNYTAPSPPTPGLGYQMTALATCPDLSSHNWTIYTDPVWREVNDWDMVPVLRSTDEHWAREASSYNAIQRLPQPLANGDQWLGFLRGSTPDFNNGTAAEVGFASSSDGRNWTHFTENPLIAPGKAWTVAASEYRPKFVGYLGNGEYLVAWAEHPNPHIIYSKTTDFKTFQRDPRGYANWGIGQDGIVSAWREGDRLYLFTGAYVHEMVLSLVPDLLPEISNEGGATGVVHDAAWLGGNLVSTGASPTEVSIFWGPDNGPTNVSGWYANEYLGPRGTGPFSRAIAGLDPNTVYYYRCYATNSGGTAWADASEKFTTTGILPFQETFEARTEGGIDWQNGWRASPSNAALVQTGLTYGGSARACSVSDGLVRHGFSDTAADSVVWVELYCRPAAGEPPDMTNGSAVMYVDVTRYVGAYDGANKVLLTDKPAVAPEEWTWFVIRNDYSTKTWDLWMNGTNMFYGFDFRSADWDVFSGFKCMQPGVLTSYLDNVEISAARPTGIELDRDADGMADDWEEYYFTSTTNSSGGPDDDWDQDGFRDLYEYLAGTDPFSPTSLLAITDLHHVSESQAVISWLSSSNRSYAVWQGTSLFESLASSVSNIPATPPVNVHTLGMPHARGLYWIGLE